jgi:acetyl esterase/lipase
MAAGSAVLLPGHRGICYTRWRLQQTPSRIAALQKNQKSNRPIGGAMTHRDPLLARRTLIKGAGLGLVAGTLAEAMPTQRARAAEGEIWSSEYWAKKGDVPLWMYRKRLAAPKPGEPSLPVLFFVHGSSVTSRVFDLHVPGHGEYSAMDEFARYGFDCWTMDHENYG